MKLVPWLLQSLSGQWQNHGPPIGLQCEPKSSTMLPNKGPGQSSWPIKMSQIVSCSKTTAESKAEARPRSRRIDAPNTPNNNTHQRKSYNHLELLRQRNELQMHRNQGCILSFFPWPTSNRVLASIHRASVGNSSNHFFFSKISILSIALVKICS